MKSAIDWIALILVIVGGLSWGLVGIFDFDVVATIFGTMSTIARVVYVVIGVAALWAIYYIFKE